MKMAMDWSSSMWLPELEMDDGGFMNQYATMSKPYDTTDSLSYGSFTAESYTGNGCFIDRCYQNPSRFEEKTEMILPGYQKASNISTKTQTPKTPGATISSSNTFTISFGDLKPEDKIMPPFDYSICYEDAGTGKVPTVARTPVQVQDHVLAERKRREKLNRQFISMSALLPNLKKMDKISVLEEATNHIIELHDRVKKLQGLSVVEQKDAKEYTIALKRSRPSDDDNEDSSYQGINFEDDSADVGSKSSAEIEVRISGGSVLVRIYSQKVPSLLGKMLRKMQELGLSVISSSSMPVANTTALIIILAQSRMTSLHDQQQTLGITYS
ncbi:Myc-type, basic helix-loop-helix (bHLH) domain-containing protein [Artemisia annua]|uniref:Myc-type, basic helix-loop-helix (BHLH) domain-containing protein n=1 Tax=Artemisia annua TaxID=35608 RepID=A0A2U1L9I3_ARTAN|nr:Myc-type, basic helix-loop-helix (bHLH) domain-containing protein [Artemisia annua]